MAQAPWRKSRPAITAPFIAYSMRLRYEMAMIRTLTLSIGCALLLSVGGTAAARDGRNRIQDNLREAAAQGQVVPLNRIVADVRSRPPYSDMTYLGGPQFDAGRMIYALKFMDGSQVVVVYVDARTGRIVGRKP